MKTIKINAFGEETNLVFIKEKYSSDNSTAISLITNDEGFWETFASLTVCIPEYKLLENEILVKTWSENELLKQLLDLEHPIFLDTGKRVPTGFVEAEVWKIIDYSYIYTEEEINKFQVENNGL